MRPALCSPISVLQTKALGAREILGGGHLQYNYDLIKQQQFSYIAAAALVYAYKSANCFYSNQGGLGA